MLLIKSTWFKYSFLSTKYEASVYTSCAQESRANSPHGSYMSPSDFRLFNEHEEYLKNFNVAVTGRTPTDE